MKYLVQQLRKAAATYQLAASIPNKECGDWTLPTSQTQRRIKEEAVRYHNFQRHGKREGGNGSKFMEQTNRLILRRAAGPRARKKINKCTSTGVGAKATVVTLGSASPLVVGGRVVGVATGRDVQKRQGRKTTGGGSGHREEEWVVVGMRSSR